MLWATVRGWCRCGSCFSRGTRWGAQGLGRRRRRCNLELQAQSAVGIVVEIVFQGEIRCQYCSGTRWHAHSTRTSVPMGFCDKCESSTWFIKHNERCDWCDYLLVLASRREELLRRISAENAQEPAMTVSFSRALPPQGTTGRCWPLHGSRPTWTRRPYTCRAGRKSKAARYLCQSSCL